MSGSAADPIPTRESFAAIVRVVTAAAKAADLGTSDRGQLINILGKMGRALDASTEKLVTGGGLYK